jgi:hypothetical protein
VTVDRGGSAISRAVSIVSHRAGVSAICIIAAVMVSGVCRSLGPDGVGAAAAASAPTHGLTGVGNWVWYYQTIAPSDAVKFSGATAVVTTTQPDTATALATIHSTGALAFIYMNAYWLPLGRIYDGIDLAQHPGWEFCGRRGNPLPPGRATGPPGQQELWMYPDLNERGMHAAFVQYLQGLKASGYDGVFFDRGVVALRRGRMPDRVSGCTAHPVRQGATYAQSFARIVRAAHAIGLQVVLNYGSAPPPRNVAKSIVRVMQEDAPGPSTAAELTTAFGRRQVESSRPTRYVEEVKTTSLSDRAGAFRSWAEVALWPIDVDINTGDNGCAGVLATAPCFHYGTFPELTSVQRGGPLGADPSSRDCSGRSTIRCLWVRRWSEAVVVVNETRQTIHTVITVGPTCRGVTDVWAEEPVAGGSCVRNLRVTIPPLSGRVYQETPISERTPRTGTVFGGSG